MTQHSPPSPLLTPEERFVWDCARNWRTPARLADPPGPNAALDWTRVVEIGRSNRMLPLLDRMLSAMDRVGSLPFDARETLRAGVAAQRELASLMGEALQHYLRLAAGRGLDTVVLKGLSLSLNVYGDPALRPGGDVDLLVRRDQVAQSLAILDEMGLGRWWPNLLDDAYYDRHHLHQQRCTQDLKIWFEPHWALDHPYTLLTVDYEAMMDRTTPGTLLGQPVRDLEPSDLLLSVAVHLVKHAVYLPSILDRPDLARIILADGMLVNYVDAAEVIKVNAAAMDWTRTIALARQSGTSEILGSVLRVCSDLLDAPVPPSVLLDTHVTGPGGLTRRIMNRMADQELATYLGLQRSRLWGFLVVTNGAFILRPIRVLDTVTYLLPSRDYLRRRYGSDSPGTAFTHLLHAVAQYGRLGIDTVYYAWERHRRLRALNRSASLFNRLEVES
jgi:Uncharacterised nucleotidyltransferase